MDKNLTLKRLSDGKHGVFDGTSQVGVIGHKHLMDYTNTRASLSELLMMSATEYALPVDQQVIARTRELMRSEGLTVGKAIKRVLLSDQDLKRRYRAAHSKEVS